jgi:hypothetical protein
MSALTTHTYGNIREKENEKKKKQKLQQAIESRKEGKEQDHLKKTSLGPLRQGQRLDTIETKVSSHKEQRPLKQSSKTTKSSPCIYASSP